MGLAVGVIWRAIQWGIGRRVGYLIVGLVLAALAAAGVEFPR